MATWNSRGLRGSTLEELINRTNEQYREKGLALIQKIPTPITPVKMDKDSRHITLAYFEQKSTVDYIGAVQGIPVCFDAKECCVKTFPLANIHPHQVAFMEADLSGSPPDKEPEIRFLPEDKIPRPVLPGGNFSVRPLPSVSRILSVCVK